MMQSGYVTKSWLPHVDYEWIELTAEGEPNRRVVNWKCKQTKKSSTVYSPKHKQFKTKVNSSQQKSLLTDEWLG